MKINCYFQQTSGNAHPALNEIEILKTTSHPHIVSFKDSFEGKFYSRHKKIHSASRNTIAINELKISCNTAIKKLLGANQSCYLFIDDHRLVKKAFNNLK